MTTNQAYAGGYDDIDLLPAEEQATKMKSIFSTLSWETWERPYLSENNLCRQKNGDVICLPTDMAKKVGAHIYSPKKSTKKVSPSLTVRPQ
ncbi:hypothetical protein [Anabaena azotica]|uniref:hypothetical protein n=1 Tax=Anabaena azotica TaxID=197653 RepID=UPI0039A69036